MYKHLENLTTNQNYIAQKVQEEEKLKHNLETRKLSIQPSYAIVAGRLINEFVDTLNLNAEYLTIQAVRDIGAEAFVRTACQIEASKGELDFFFEGFMNKGDRIDFFQKRLGSIEDFLSDEADLDGINMIERVNKIREFFPKNVESKLPMPSDTELTQGDLYDVFLDDDTDHEHYDLIASSFTCEVLEVLAGKFTKFLAKKVKLENVAMDSPNKQTVVSGGNYQEGYDAGYLEGYEQAKKDVISALFNNQN